MRKKRIYKRRDSFVVLYNLIIDFFSRTQKTNAPVIICRSSIHFFSSKLKKYLFFISYFCVSYLFVIHYWFVLFFTFNLTDRKVRICVVNDYFTKLYTSQKVTHTVVGTNSLLCYCVLASLHTLMIHEYSMAIMHIYIDSYYFF